MAQVYLNECLKLGKFFPYSVINGKQQKKLRKLQSLDIFIEFIKEHISRRH